MGNFFFLGKEQTSADVENEKSERESVRYSLCPFFVRPVCLSEPPNRGMGTGHFHVTGIPWISGTAHLQFRLSKQT